MANVKKTVVIVGGGYAGLGAFTELDKKKIKNLKIVLISKNNFFYHIIGTPRTLVDEKWANEIVIPFDNAIKGENKEFIHAMVTKIDLNEIKYKRNGQSEEEAIGFDYLVLALGSTYPSVFQASKSTIRDQLNEIKETHVKFKSATSVLILGGGPVGVETAGEIATDMPNVKVTLITSSNKLIAHLSNAVAEKTLNVLRQKKVEVIFNDSIDLKNVENYKKQKLVTKNGKEIEFDAYFVCYGSKPATDTVKASFPNWLNEHGQIKVNKNLQVLDTKNIFAIGDCNDWKEAKVAYFAGKHAEVAAANIQLLVDNKQKLKEHETPSKNFMILSIGRDDGAYQIACLSGTGFLATNIKSKNLLLPRMKSNFKL